MLDFICGPGNNPPEICPDCGHRYHRSVEIHQCKRKPMNLDDATIAELQRKAEAAENAKLRAVAEAARVAEKEIAYARSQCSKCTCRAYVTIELEMAQSRISQALAALDAKEAAR